MMQFVRIVVLVTAVSFWFNANGGEAYGGTLGFDIHHRYSPTVQEFLDIDGLPEKDSLDYFNAMAHRDMLLNGRRLADTPPSGSLLTFSGSNKTFQLGPLGFLHYAFVRVGTPPVTFLVALDTGSDLFWLPCACTTCLRQVNISSNTTLNLNIYNPGNSSTGSLVPCNSTLCGPDKGCATNLNACAYQEQYLSTNTSSTGVLVDDVLHMGTETDPQTLVDVPITLGCGVAQTGDFIRNAAVNGLFGLGMDNLSVPSILANKGLTANSFSMCFGLDGIGRIEFGDKGSPDQLETPFSLRPTRPTYNVSITQISMGRNITDAEFTAIFDSGTSFTYLNEPAYSIITSGFNSRVIEPRYQPQQQLIFDFCYSLSANQTSFTFPKLNFTMKGGSQFFFRRPTIIIPREDGGIAYCLAVVKSNNLNLIGQNFMTGYRVVFDREKMVLGWKVSDCSGLPSSSGGNGTTAPAPSSDSTPALPPVVSENDAPPRVRRVVSPPPQPSPSVNATRNGAATWGNGNRIVLLVVSLLCYYQIIAVYSS